MNGRAIGLWLLYQRREAGDTQLHLAAASGVSIGRIGALERGEADPHLSTINRLLGRYGYRLTIERDVPSGEATPSPGSADATTPAPRS